MTNFVAYIVKTDDEGRETFELVDMKNRVLKDSRDVMAWLAYEVPKRPDLAGRRIDVVDLDEPLPPPALIAARRRGH